MRLVALFLSLAVTAPAPLFAQNVSPDMVCFMEAADGQMIDLEGLCGPKQSTASTVASIIPRRSNSSTAADRTTSAARSRSADSTVPGLTGRRIDETKLGGNSTGGSSSSGGSSGGAGGSGSGRCNFASDRASDGSLCGGRAASER